MGSLQNKFEFFPEAAIFYWSSYGHFLSKNSSKMRSHGPNTMKEPYIGLEF